ncbi:MAG: hypothetical protein KatS3mg087_0177 [Patescibacteria group bacterium]|nr:MAG: hypothetical protein KatS3mg087_0177 [Patescibacteria group bacterium]
MLKKSWRANSPQSLTQRIRSRAHWKRRLLFFFLLTVTIGIGLFSFAVYTFWSYADGLIATERLVNRQFRGLIMYDQSGNVIYESGVQYRSGNVPIAEVPDSLKNATVAVEDKDFYRHIGFSVPAMIRALFANTQEGEIVQGASTITQQLVKNALLGDSSVRYVRKVREIILAFAIEYRYSKEELLGLYLNSIYYGRGAWGVGDAAKNYFGKNVQELTAEEATFLAGLPQSPSRYSANLQLAKNRHRQVLRALREQGFINAEEEKSWGNAALNFAEYQSYAVKYPFFTLAARRELAELLGVSRTLADAASEEEMVEALVSRGLYVYTTLNMEQQEKMEVELRDGVEELRERNVTNGASMIVDARSGAIRAYAGSRDWFDDSQGGKFDVLISEQQPGSTLKPLIYAAAINEGVIGTESILRDTRRDFGGYVPVNYDGRFRGNVSVARSLANSLNVPAVEVLQRLGMDSGIRYLIKMGINSLETEPAKQNEANYSYAQDYGLSLVLGGYEVRPKELIGAYTTLANSGVHNGPYMVERVTDRFGNELYRKPATGVQVLKPAVTGFVYNTLSDRELRRETFGNRAENLEISGKKVAVKTGTTDDYRDSWAIGYDSRYVVGVWVGNNDNSPMREVAGSVGGASVWKRIFEGL